MVLDGKRSSTGRTRSAPARRRAANPRTSSYRISTRSRVASFALGDDDSPYEASGPNFISLPGYTEMLSGQPALCQENECVFRPLYTVADSFRDAGASRDEVAVIASWEKLETVASHDASSIVVTTGRSHGATRDLLRTDAELATLLDEGEHADPAPGHDDYRPDRYTAEIATRYLALRRPRFLFVALGDTDEYGHQGDYDAYLDALRRADRTVGEIMRITDAWAREGDDTVILVTADHGRAKNFLDHGRDYPESRRTWLIGAGREFHPAARGGRLADIAPAIEGWAGIAPPSEGLARTDADVLLGAR